MLHDLAVLFAVVVLARIVLLRLGAPDLLGFLLAGLLVGPHGFGLVASHHEVEEMAELGVVLLLFTIGLEFAETDLARLGRAMGTMGGAQVALTAVLFGALSFALGLPARSAVFVGAVVSLSSTAVVLRHLDDEGALDAPHGRAATAVLLFQDLLLVPLVVFLPVLAGQAGAFSAAALSRSALAVAALAALSRYGVPLLLRWAAHTKRRDVYLLAVAATAVGFSALSEAGRLSPALGAFLAGLAIAATPYGAAAFAEAVPFREIFAGLFFVSIGMLLEPMTLAARWGVVLPAVAAVVGGKALAAGLALSAAGLPRPVAVRAGVSLAQVGEFAFVLLGLPAAGALLDEADRSVLVGVICVSLAATPFLVRAGDWLAERLGDRAAPAAPAEGGHAVVVGYGVVGRAVVEALRAAGVPVVVVEANPGTVERGGRGVQFLYGDGTRAAVLEAAGAARAAAVVVTVPDPPGARRAVAAARSVAPDARVLVRTRFAAEEDPLRRLGADEVVVEEVEAGRALSARAAEVLGARS